MTRKKEDIDLNVINLSVMLNLQASMNSKINPDWLTARHPFLRAVVVEAVEGIDHHGYKWWKAENPDMEQLQMELIDIWHFALSHFLLSTNGNNDDVVELILGDLNNNNGLISFDNVVFEFSKMDLLSKLELLIGLAVVRKFSVSLFESILNDCNMKWVDLYRQYIGKNALNFFRQDNGYKEGTYNKIWNGNEDNVHLVDILNALDSNSASFYDEVYAGLQDIYNKLAT